MSSTPPEGPPPPGPVPQGYQPGDYIPFKDRDPANPTAIAGQASWSDQAAAQQQALAAEQGPVDPYRALYGWDAPDRVVLAGWGRRVLAYLFDYFLAMVAFGPGIVGYVLMVQDLDRYIQTYGGEEFGPGWSPPSNTVAMILVGAALYLAFFVYNYCLRQGRTGYTLGKTVVGIKLVKEQTKQPVGAGMSFLRQLAHVVDGLVCNLGYLWPLWDSKKQTFADKICGTLVVVQAQEDPRQQS